MSNIYLRDSDGDLWQHREQSDEWTAGHLKIQDIDLGLLAPLLHPVRILGESEAVGDLYAPQGRWMFLGEGRGCWTAYRWTGSSPRENLGDHPVFSWSDGGWEAGRIGKRWETVKALSKGTPLYRMIARPGEDVHSESLVRRLAQVRLRTD